MNLNLLSNVKQRILSTNERLYINYLKNKGVTIGEGTRLFTPVTIDLTRPFLIEIGKNCVLTQNVVILTHGFEWAVLREKYGTLLSSSGKVVIEDNVFIGTNSIILKGVRIGKDSIIGAGSIVPSDIPGGSVAAGNPCKVLMSIDQYYEKRKEEYIREAKVYAFEIYSKSGKIPREEDFREEFPLFLQRDEDWGKIPVRKQLKSAMKNFLENKPIYGSFEEFLIDSGVPKEKIEKKDK